MTCTSTWSTVATYSAYTVTLTDVDGKILGTHTEAATTWSDSFPDYYYVDPAKGCGNGTGSNYTQVTTVISDFTMTSPTPYIQFTSVYRYNWCGKLPSGMST
jgi:hypothetical protein